VIIAMAERAMLEKHGYTVLTAGTGEQAVDLASSNNDIDLILMDINLGTGIDGTEAASMILENCDIPLAFLSSHTERDVVEKTEGITSYGYIVKNSGETVLLASIWNKKHETMTGFSAEELSTMSLSDWFGEDDLRRVNEAVKQVFETGYGEVEADLLIKGGGTLRILSNGVLLSMGGKNYFTGVGLDVTERRKAERRIEEQLEELRRWHSVTLGREGRILDLKAEINQLLTELGRPPRYPSAMKMAGFEGSDPEAKHE